VPGLVATRLQRARQAVEARRRVIPLIAAFFLGFAAARSCYPLLRPVFVGGPLAPLKLGVLEAHRAAKPCCEVTASPWVALGSVLTVGAGLLSLSFLVQEQRRRSATKSLLRNRLYRVGLAAFTASFFAPWLSRGDVGTAFTEVLLGVAGCAVLSAAWPGWGRRTRLQAVALFLVAAGLAVLLGYHIDSLVLKG
jgi:hypothetical protein